MISCFLRDCLGEDVMTLVFLLVFLDGLDLVILSVYESRLSCCCGGPVGMDM